MAKEILKDAQLEQVAGGSWMESVSDVNEAFKRKLPALQISTANERRLQKIKILRQTSEGF